MFPTAFIVDTSHYESNNEVEMTHIDNELGFLKRYQEVYGIVRNRMCQPKTTLKRMMEYRVGFRIDNKCYCSRMNIMSYENTHKGNSYNTIDERNRLFISTQFRKFTLMMEINDLDIISSHNGMFVYTRKKYWRLLEHYDNMLRSDNRLRSGDINTRWGNFRERLEAIL